MPPHNRPVGARKDGILLFRFSLYGFLKNQRYFEPFIILFFLDQGLSFTLIGVLVAIREFSTNLMEIPSGALADLYGRRQVDDRLVRVLPGFLCPVRHRGRLRAVRRWPWSFTRAGTPSAPAPTRR